MNTTGRYHFTYECQEEGDQPQTTINMVINSDGSLENLLSILDQFIKMTGHSYDGKLTASKTGNKKKTEQILPVPTASDSEGQEELERNFAGRVEIKETEYGDKMLIKAKSADEAYGIYRKYLEAAGQTQTPNIQCNEYSGETLNTAIHTLPTLS